MKKEYAERQWLELNKMQKRIRIKRVGETNPELIDSYGIILQELEKAKFIFKQVIDP